LEQIVEICLRACRKGLRYRFIASNVNYSFEEDNVWPSRGLAI